MLAGLVLALTVFVLVSAAQLHFGQRRWALYEGEMQDPVDDPPGAWDKTEFAFGRLRYRSEYNRGAYEAWGIDTNKADRQFLQGLRRLTRVQARSVEQIVDIDSDEMFDYPWLFASSAGDWEFTDAQALRFRKFFERGGFMMVDDFHGEREWNRFMAGISRAIPSARVVELTNDDPIMHVVYDLNERFRISGANVVHGRGYERDGVIPHWRAIVDEKGRVEVAISFNNDIGDAWEYADGPNYPEKMTSLAYRLGINYVLYDMTH